jgi:hypothetical protein
MLKKIGKWLWDTGLDMFFMAAGAVGFILAHKNRDAFMLATSMWLLTVPLFDRKLKIITEQLRMLIIAQLPHVFMAEQTIKKMEAAEQQEAK